MKKINLVLTALLLGFPITSPVLSLNTAHAETAQANTPLKEIKDTIDKIIGVVEVLPGESNKDARRSKLRELINPKFNFDEMARRSLGSNWTTITPEEQKEFVEIFSELLARTYLAKIETVKTGMVTVDKEELYTNKALVRTTVTSKGSTFPIDYKLQLENNNWRVYYMIIENIGLVANYRTDFAEIIRKEKFSGLLERLRQKAA